MVFVVNYLYNSSIVYRLEVGNQDEISLWSLSILIILFDYSCWFSRLFLTDVSVNQICEVTKFWARFSKKLDIQKILFLIKVLGIASQ